MFVVVVVVVTFSFTGAYQPWRATMLNHFDVASSNPLAKQRIPVRKVTLPVTLQH